VSFRTGVIVSLCVVALAALKIGAVVRVLWGRLPVKLAGVVLLELATLQLMPSIFTWFDHHGGVRWQQCYAWWWVAGSLVAALGVTRIPFEGDVVPIRRVMRIVYLGLPLVSLVAHLSMLHWVYRIGFAAADLSPVLLGLTVLLERSPVGKHRELRNLGVLMLVAALLLASGQPGAVVLRGIPFTPEQLTLGATYATTAYCFFGVWFGPLMAAGAGLATVILFGPTFEETCLAVADAYRRVVAVVRLVVPEGAIEWGAVAMAASLVFLAMGVMVSLRRGEAPESPAAVEAD
jgi:hypothetical protein